MIKRALLTLLFAHAPLAQYTTIVPVAGDGNGIDISYGAYVWVTNVSSAPANIHAGDFYPQQKCRHVDEPLTVKPGETVFFSPLCGPLFAFTIESDQQIVVRDDVGVGFYDACGFSFNEQNVLTQSDWLPANRDVAFPRVFVGDTWRSNLIITNPNASAIDVDVHLARTDVGGSIDRHFTVAARSVASIPLPEATPVFPTPPPFTPIALNGAHDATIRAGGPFMAGVSSISPFYREAIYRNPVLLGR
jgi:hypothetical protein